MNGILIILGVTFLIVSISAFAIWWSDRKTRPEVMVIPPPKVMPIEEARRRNIKQVEP